MPGPTVSVVIPAYNAADYIGEAIESVVRQTLRPAEIIVVDDGSTDNTQHVLRQYEGTVTTIRQPNAGEGAARNSGIAAASGKYIAFLDADDVSAPTRMEIQVSALEETGAVACFTGHYTFSNERLAEFPAVETEATDSLALLAECRYVASSAMFSRAAAYGLRFPEVKGASAIDLIFSAMLATRGRVIAVPELLYGYRMHAEQISIGYRASRGSNPFFEFRHQWALEHWREYWPERSWSEVERCLWQGLVRQTEAAYWARHRQFFLNDRNYLRDRWPKHLPPPSVLSWRWYPDWLWAAKGIVDRIRRPVAS